MTKTERPPAERRALMGAILYLNQTGCLWRSFPREYPLCKMAYTVFWRWRRDESGIRSTTPFLERFVRPLARSRRRVWSLSTASLFVP
ncbi:transposase [Schlesneria sp. T3-172]|uniref:transposase n=1 Tax=Schlesneria TaxID=656899 RepID=UPI0037CBF7AF